jgi:hypothetical protein
MNGRQSQQQVDERYRNKQHNQFVFDSHEFPRSSFIFIFGKSSMTKPLVFSSSSWTL